MSTIVESIDVAVPVRTAYDQWTQFEEFPHFMEGVKSVKQLDDTTLEWTAEIAGVERSWTAEITDQEPGPDGRLAVDERRQERGSGHVPAVGRQHDPYHAPARGRTRGTRGDAG